MSCCMCVDPEVVAVRPAGCKPPDPQTLNFPFDTLLQTVNINRCPLGHLGMRSDEWREYGSMDALAGCTGKCPLKLSGHRTIPLRHIRNLLRFFQVDRILAQNILAFQ